MMKGNNNHSIINSNNQLKNYYNNNTKMLPDVSATKTEEKPIRDNNNKYENENKHEGKGDGRGSGRSGGVGNDDDDKGNNDKFTKAVKPLKPMQTVYDANEKIKTTKTNSITAMKSHPPNSAKHVDATDVTVQLQHTAAHVIMQQQPQQQQQQLQIDSNSSTKSQNATKTINDKRDFAAEGEGNDFVIDTANTSTTTNNLPLNSVNFDLDLRFGCAHYNRRAMFVTPCCNKFYKCRFCHDENESHHFDRKTLTELICSECNRRQKVQEQCEACGTRFGKYTCLICNLFDDTDKKQYHCNDCGICRIGGVENFFHCEVCDMCLPIRLKIDGHRCVENISRSHCPVCLGDIHTSRIPCHIPDCGHLLHKTCFEQLLNSRHYTCPICQTSVIDMTALWDCLDAHAVFLPVPKKYENQQIQIFCNDCHKTSKTKFNFIGLKCMQCGAYNTTQDVKRRISLVADEPSSA